MKQFLAEAQLDEVKDIGQRDRMIGGEERMVDLLPFELAPRIDRRRPATYPNKYVHIYSVQVDSHTLSTHLSCEIF